MLNQKNIKFSFEKNIAPKSSKINEKNCTAIEKFKFKNLDY